MSHLTTSFKNHPFVHTQARSQNIASKNGWAVNFDPVFGFEAPIDFSADNDRSSINLGIDLSPFPDDKSIRGINLSPERPSNSHRTMEAEFSFKFTAVVDDSCN